jgi:hypothetical protein
MYWHKMLWKFAEWEPSCSLRMGGQTDRKTDGQADWWLDRQTDRHDEANTFSARLFRKNAYKRFRPTASIQTLCNTQFEVTLSSDVGKTMQSIYVITEGLVVDTWICSVRRHQKSGCYTKMNGKYCLEGHTWLERDPLLKMVPIQRHVLQQSPNRIAKSRTTAVFVGGLCANDKNNGSFTHECVWHF